MSVISAIKQSIEEMQARAADASRRLVGVRDFDTAKAAAVEKLAAEAVVASLAGDLADAEATAEIDRLADARKARLAKIEQEQAKAARDGASLQKGLPDKLTAAVSDLRAVVAACKAAGFSAGIDLPAQTYIERTVAEMAAKGRNMSADAKALSADFLDQEAALLALGEARQAFEWANGSSAPTMPHVGRAAYSRLVEADSDQAAFVRENWRAPDADARDRVLSLLVEGNAL